MLALDVGNTQIVVGYFLDCQLKQTWRLSTRPFCTADEFKSKLDLVLSSSGIRFELIQEIIVSSVVPQLTRILRSAFQNKKLSIIDHSWPFSFDIVANPPDQVGADRLVNAETVVREYGFPAIVVDSGTATTLCGISKGAHGRAEYLGGAIIPGIEMAMEALAKNTAQLFTIDLTPPQRAIGNNTQEALKSGMILGYASMIDGMIRRFKLELGQNDLPVIATGGISHLMKGIAQELTLFDADITLKGIAYLHETIRKR